MIAALLSILGLGAWGASVAMQAAPLSANAQRITAPAEPDAAADAVRFFPVHVFIDPGEHPLAAYQFELTASDAAVRIVGLEGGEHPAFREPPHYDPAAMLGERVIAAAFSLDDANALPSGRTRIATVHVQVPAGRDVTFDVQLQEAATVDGRAIPATLHLQLQGPHDE